MNKIERENKELRDKISNFEKIDFTYISKGGKVKMISWGRDYKKWEVERRLEYAEALASAMNEACDIIQQERDKYLIENRKLSELLKEAENGLEIQRNNNINSITKSNKDKQELIKRIRELEK